MKHPCYNKETKTDCPDRRVACGASCPKWAAYIAEREKIYTERKMTNLARSAHYEKVAERVAKKENHRRRRGKLY